MDSRQKAFTDYYNTQEKFQTIEAARGKAKKGWHILKVNPITDAEPFYILENFGITHSWLEIGSGLGNWNELIVIEKIK